MRTRTQIDMEATVASLAAAVTELEADKTALKKQLEEAWAAADTARAQRDQAMGDCSRLFAHGSKALDQRDQARAIAVELEQELAAGDARVWREVADWVREACEDTGPDGTACEECESQAWLIDHQADRKGPGRD